MKLHFGIVGAVALTAALVAGCAGSKEKLTPYQGSDSINHVMSPQELTSVFNNVYGALRSGGLFVFDVKSEDGFKARWQGTTSITAKDHVVAVESAYDPKRREGRFSLAAFRLEKHRWERTDAVITEKAYTRVEIERRLAKSLFKSIRAYDAQRDFKLKEVGRLFFVCER